MAVKSKKKSKRVVKRVKNNNKEVLRKDFEIFGKGVQRLEEIRVELDNLNTAGYEAEVNSIRSKLKNVSYIPQVENEMQILRSKIKGTYRSKTRKIRKSKKHGPSKYTKKIDKKIRKLENELKKRKKPIRGLSNKNKKLIDDIPKIEGQISSLKSVLKQIQEDEKIKNELIRNVDPGVNLLVNNKFNLSLNEI